MTATAPLLAADQLSDHDVVRRVLDGETPLFEILMRRYNQRVYRAVRAVLRGEDEAEDVMQQAWLNAFRSLRQFAERAQFSTWLTRIAVNEALAKSKKRSRMEWQPMMEIQSQEPTPEQQAVTSQMRDVVEAEVAALPDAYRTVLVLRDVEGLSTAETASCLDVSEDLVKQRLHRARTMVRDGLARRAGVTLETIYEFGNARCDRIVAAVLRQIT